MKPKKPKRSNPLMWAAGGAIAGLAVAAVSAPPFDEFPFLGWIWFAGYFVGGAVSGAFLAGIIAVIRNLFIR